MKLIFLDVDGVLNSIGRAKMQGPFNYTARGINPLALSMLRELCERTAAKIVISSTWRNSIGSSVDWWKGCFAAHGWEHPQAPVIGLTPSLSKGFRGDEISEFLVNLQKDCNPKTSISYVIFDDDSDFHPGQPLIKVDGEHGLTWEHVCKAHFMLTGKEFHSIKPSN